MEEAQAVPSTRSALYGSSWGVASRPAAPRVIIGIRNALNFNKTQTNPFTPHISLSIDFIWPICVVASTPNNASFICKKYYYYYSFARVKGKYNNLMGFRSMAVDMQKLQKIRQQ